MDLKKLFLLIPEEKITKQAYCVNRVQAQITDMDMLRACFFNCIQSASSAL